MNDVTKIPFSLAEMQLIESADVFLTKKKAFEHVKLYLSYLQQDIDTAIQNNDALRFVKDEFAYRKISYGESYQSMPYQVSDFPAKFSKGDIFAIRCLVWWGNEVSIHFLLQGSFYEKYSNDLKTNLGQLPEGFFRCVANNPWEHHFNSSNYIPINLYSVEDAKGFCKIGKKYALSILTKGREEIINDVILLLKLVIKN
jgi:hypothetical protein